MAVAMLSEQTRPALDAIVCVVFLFVFVFVDEAKHPPSLR